MLYIYIYIYIYRNGNFYLSKNIYKYIEMEIPSHLRFTLVKDFFPYTMSIYGI